MSFTTRFFDTHSGKEVSDPATHDTRQVATCDADGSRVTIFAVGTSEHARCEREGCRNRSARVCRHCGRHVCKGHFHGYFKECGECASEGLRTGRLEY